MTGTNNNSLMDKVKTRSSTRSQTRAASVSTSANNGSEFMKGSSPSDAYPKSSHQYRTQQNNDISSFRSNSAPDEHSKYPVNANAFKNKNHGTNVHTTSSSSTSWNHKSNMEKHTTYVYENNKNASKTNEYLQTPVVPARHYPPGVGSSRPESRCSQHSTASASMNNETSSGSGIPPGRDSRTTTSRRGGRPPRSRSPLTFSSRRDSNTTTLPTSNTTNATTAVIATTIQQSDNCVSPSTIPSNKIDESKSSKSKDTSTEIEGEMKVKSEKDVLVHHSNGRNHQYSKAPSSVAKKAAAEAQRLSSLAHEHESYSRHYHHYEAHERYHQYPYPPHHPPYTPHGGGHNRGYYGSGNSTRPAPLEYMDGERRTSDKEAPHHYHHPHRNHNRQNVFRRQPPHILESQPPSEQQHSQAEHEFEKQRFTTRTKTKVNKPTTMGATTHVMGSTTPMQGCKPIQSSDSNKKGDQQKPQHQSHQHISKVEPSSTFANDSVAPPGSPQRILMDMKIGSKSFDLKSPLPTLSHSGSMKPCLPLSPQEPPEIQHSHQQINSNSFLFEPQKTPRTPKTPKSPKNNGIFGSPTFNLFNQDYFNSFDDNETLNLPTPNQNSKLSLLDNDMNDIRSPSLSMVRSIDDGSPRKHALMMNSPYLDGLDSTFSPRMSRKSQSNGKTVKESFMDGAPPMPQVIVTDSKDDEENRKPALEFKRESNHHPLKKRILEKEKRTPARFVGPRKTPMDDQKLKKTYEKSSSHYPPQRRKPHLNTPDHHPTYRHQMRYHRTPMGVPPPPTSGHAMHQFHHKYPLPMPKMRCHTPIPSLAGMKAAHFYQVLRSHKDAFGRFSFLLPGLKALMELPKPVSWTVRCLSFYYSLLI